MSWRGLRYILYAAWATMLLPAVVLAQTVDCPLIVRQALESADTACQDTGRNQACYGNIILNAEAQPDSPQFTFEAAGDRAELEAIKSLTLSPMDKLDNTWGVALLKVQANLPDTLPGQNVTFLLFGDVNIRNAQTRHNTLPRATLTLTPDNPEPQYGPMQAFYFRTGTQDAPCSEAPDSGILIQTPKGAGKIDLLVNEVTISLGSTVYLQAQAGGDMTISVVEGQATVSALGVTAIAPAGTRVRVPMDANLIPTGPPAPVEAYAAVDLAALPVTHLPDVVVIAAPLTADALATLAAQATATPAAAAPGGGGTAQGGTPISGAWCPAATGCAGGIQSSTLTFTVEEGGAVITVAYSGGADRYTRNDDGTYSWQQGNNSAVLTIFAPDHIAFDYSFGASKTHAEWVLQQAG
ncbi:MAG: hypothetical protein R3E39_25965 [Anaerolineae bacterium]